MVFLVPGEVPESPAYGRNTRQAMAKSARHRGRKVLP
jgi:hypothetical protein